MPSAKKTPNYGLNQWEPNEHPKREDFVNDNAIIDEALKENSDAAANAAAAAENAKNTANAAIPKSMATGADQVLVSTGAGTWAAKTLAQFKTWLALKAENISDFADKVRSTVLTGLSTATNAVITASDTVLSALGKLQAQITAHAGNKNNPHNVTASQVGAYSKTESVSDATKALYGLGANAVPDDVFAAANGIMTKNLINILRLKLQQSLKANDIDAWSDLLADASGINTGASSGYTISGGALTATVTPTIIEQTSDDASQYFGRTDISIYGQVFTTAAATSQVVNIKVKLSKNGSPTDNLVCKIYTVSGSAPATLLYTSAPVSGASLSETPTDYTFTFTGAVLDASTTYIFTIERVGALDNTNYYYIRSINSGAYAGGDLVRYLVSTTTWQTLSGQDLYFIISVNQLSTATVIWNAVTPTEALTMMAITADQTAGTGTITWYLSDDGTNWTQITALDAMQAVNFDVASVRLKCILTGNAEVRAVAWGGY